MTTETRPRVPLSLLLLVGIVAISFSSIFVRWSTAPVSVIAMYRLLLTTLLMLPFLLKYRSFLASLSVREWNGLFWSGFALGVHFLFWMGSLRLTTVASSTAIIALEPVFVLLGAVLFLRQKTNGLAVLSMLTAIAGAVLIGWGDWGTTSEALLGDLLSLLGTIAVAVHMIMGKKLVARIPSFVYSFFVFLFAALVLAVYNVSQGHPFGGYPAWEWGNFLLLAVVPTLFGHYLFNWLLRYMRPESVSMSVLGEPLGSTLLAYLLLGESLTWLQAAAGAVLLTGVWMFLRSNEKPKPKPAALPEVQSA
ncbi:MULTISPECIES: DMT family transporter [Paenibacillus]|uniref:DMT family transporter n=1 Tax=Paenibacillus TaxID=44249 RepID=UPI0022B8EE09|nr:DMT family transporter [Paenibacillus caseinilyticus]MCZ8521744.1 DMT family transporter [Paenibacillus caseinilyticus]